MSYNSLYRKPKNYSWSRNSSINQTLPKKPNFRFSATSEQPVPYSNKNFSYNKVNYSQPKGNKKYVNEKAKIIEKKIIKPQIPYQIPYQAKKFNHNKLNYSKPKGNKTYINENAKIVEKKIIKPQIKKNYSSFRHRNTYQIHHKKLPPSRYRYLRQYSKLNQKKKSVPNQKALVLSGMSYKKTDRFHLKKIQNNYHKKGSPIKPQINNLNISGSEYKISENGKTLTRIDSSNTSSVPKEQLFVPKRVSVNGYTFVKSKNQTLNNSMEVSKKESSKAFASQRVKRSIRKVLQKSAPKNCLFYTKFGTCSKGEKCPYVHDPEKRDICKKFLKGKCNDDDCKLLHKVVEGRVPVCFHFLHGICTNENCNYSHVYVSDKAEVCQEFLEGFCPLGDTCKKKHIESCKIWDKTGTCPDGENCKFGHSEKKKKVNKIDNRNMKKRKLEKESKNKNLVWNNSQQEFERNPKRRKISNGLENKKEEKESNNNNFWQEDIIFIKNNDKIENENENTEKKTSKNIRPIFNN